MGIFTIGSALQTGAVEYGMLTVARLIGGIGIGMYVNFAVFRIWHSLTVNRLSMVAPLYISEISPPEIRGALLVLEEFSIVTGIVIAFWSKYNLRKG